MFGVTKFFFDAALPWVLVSVVLAFVMAYSDNDMDKEKEHEK
jgi:hypothetical protein